MMMSNEGGGAGALNEAQCAKRIARAVAAERRMYRQVSAAAERGDLRRLARMYVLSFDVRVAALHAENKRRDWRRKRLVSGDFGEDRRLAHSDVLDRASHLNILAPSSEPVRLKPIAKRNGDYRIVCQFGIEQKARQRIMRRLLDLLAERRSNCQFLLVGRHAALRQVAIEAHARGHRFAAELDVTNQFGSFDEGALPRFLPELPAKSVGANLVPTRMNFDHRKLSSIPEEHTRRPTMPRQGLPPGASTSPVVAEILMAKVLVELPWEILSHVTIVTYADNILVLGPTKASVNETCACLSDAFGRSAVGSLRLKSRGVKGLRSGVEFLGTKIVCNPERVTLTMPVRKRRSLVRCLHREWQQHRSVGRLEARARSYLGAEAMDASAPFSAALVTQAIVQQSATIAELDALERYARRSMSETGRLSPSAVMLDRPVGGEWRAIKRSLQERGIAA